MDFDLVSHGNARRATLAHLAALEPRDVVVYDRGYYSFWMLQSHLERGLHAVFRLKRNANALFREFIRGPRAEALVTVRPSSTTREQHPEAALRPCRVRLVKYTVGESDYALATTLLDRRRYPASALAELYHGRWAIEELYKVSKQRLAVEEFHGRGERTVKQEVFAHFSLIAMTRLFTNRSEESWRAPSGRAYQARHAGELQERPGGRGAAPGRAAGAAREGVVRDGRQHSGIPEELSPEMAPGPLLPAAFPQASRQMEVPQGTV